ARRNAERQLRAQTRQLAIACADAHTAARGWRGDDRRVDLRRVGPRFYLLEQLNRRSYRAVHIERFNAGIYLTGGDDAGGGNRLPVMAIVHGDIGPGRPIDHVTNFISPRPLASFRNRSWQV